MYDAESERPMKPRLIALLRDTNSLTTATWADVRLIDYE